MSVKYALLALLAAEPASTYRLRKRFDESTGNSWPLNIGQVSTTMQRLEKAGLVVKSETPFASGEEADSGQPWELTKDGLAELHKWWKTPVITEHRGRDELVVKVMLGTLTPGVNFTELIQIQRAAIQQTMHDLTRIKREIAANDLIGKLTLDHHIFMAEADLRWLDDAEGTVARMQLSQTATTSPSLAKETVKVRSGK